MGVFEKLGTRNMRPVGMRFRPTENELINYYLKRKLQGHREDCQLIPDLDIYQWEPQALFEEYDERSDEQSDGRECFFFCTRTGSNRMTGTGYWKETRKRHIVKGRDGNPIWSKKILVYHEGRQPKGRKSHYSMHEYHLCSPSKPQTNGSEMELVLCRVINREDKMTGPDSPSSECVDPDPVIPSASTTANPHVTSDSSSSGCINPDPVIPGASITTSQQLQICVSSNNKDEDEDIMWMMQYNESLEDAEPQVQFYNTDEFLADGCSSSSTAIDPILINLHDIDGMTISDLLGLP